MKKSLTVRAAVVSALLLVIFLGAWQLATAPKGGGTEYEDPEYAALMGGGGARRPATSTACPSSGARSSSTMR